MYVCMCVCVCRDADTLMMFPLIFTDDKINFQIVHVCHFPYIN